MSLWGRFALFCFKRKRPSNTNKPAGRMLSLGFHLLEQRTLMSLESLSPQSLADYTDDYYAAAAVWFEQLSASSAARVSSGGFTLEQATGKVRWQTQLVDVFTDEWIVRLAPAAVSGVQSVAQVARLLASEEYHIEVIGGLGLVGQVLVRVSGAAFEDAAAWLAANPNVAYCEPNVVMPLAALPNDSQFNLVWGLHNTGQTVGGQPGTTDADIDAPEAWHITTGSSRIVVAVIDTGVDYTHPDLARNIWVNTGEIPGNGIDDDGNGFIDDYYGWDFANNDNNPLDDHGHGTHVAGIIGAVGNNGLGVTGVAWSVSIMPIKFLAANGSGSLDNAIRAINYVTMMRNRGVDVRLSNNSWGGGGYYQSLYDAIAAHNRAAIMFVAAAGNNARNTDLTPNYPSCYNLENVISVAATDNRDNLAAFSNYGAVSVDLAAPGVNIYSTKPGGGYQFLSGTSMAAPYVSGVAALAWSVAPNATVAEVRNALLSGVDRIPALAGKVASGGRLNARGTLDMLNMIVAGSLPVAGTSVSIRPTEFTITFSQPYDSASVQPSDFTVNGIPADSVILLTANSVKFRYNVSPVRTEGLQTMQIAEGAVRRAGGGPLRAWQAAFYYDSLPTAVLAVTPSQNALLAAAPQAITLTFNEALATASIGIDDLVLSAGRVTAATLIGPAVVRYTVDLAGVNGAVTYTLRAGAVTDLHGNPSPGYTGCFTIDDPAVLRYQATDVPKRLVDYGTVVSHLTITNGRIITDVDVELNITHTWVADLDISLVAPNGRVVRLVSGAGGNGANFTATTFDDEANTPITAGSAPFTGRFRPLESLSALDGLNAQGTWRLVVTDTDPWDTGTINGWALVFRTTTANNPPILATIPNQTNIGRPWSVALRASDPDGDQLTFSAVARAVGSSATVPVALNINQQTRILTINPNGYRGAFEVEVSVGDGRAVAVQRFRVNAATSIAVRSLASLSTGVGTNRAIAPSALDELAAGGQLPTTPAAQLSQATLTALERAHALAQLDPRWVLFAQEQWYNIAASQFSSSRRDRPVAEIV